MTQEDDYWTQARLNIDRMSSEMTKDIDAAEARPWYTVPHRAVGGAAKGGLNVIAEIGDTILDVGAMSVGANVGGLSAIASGDFDQIGTKMLEGADAAFQETEKLKGITSFIRQHETDDNVANLAMNMTESVGKFALAYSALGRTKYFGGVAASTGKKIVKEAARAGIAGAAEGLSDNPDRELWLAEKAFEKTVETFLPDALDDYRLAMNPNTPRSAAQTAFKRVASALEVGLLSSAGGAMFDTLGIGAKAASGKVMEQGAKAVSHLPDSVRHKIVDTYVGSLQNIRTVKQWVAGGRKGSLDDFAENAAKAVEVDASKIDITDLQTIPAAIQMPERKVPFLSSDDVSKYISEISVQLDPALDALKGRVVSMGQAKGLSDEFAAENYFRAFGREHGDIATREGKKQAIAVMASNHVLKSETDKLTNWRKAIDAGLAKETDEAFLAQFKSFLSVTEQRDAMLTGAGRALRTAQETTKEATLHAQGTRKLFREIEGIIDNPEVSPLFIKNILDMNRDIEMYGAPASHITDSLISAIRNKGAKSTVEFLESVAQARRMSLLSSTVTLSQNTLGSFAQGLVLATDKMSKATLTALRGRKQGEITIGEAFINYQVLLHGHISMGVLGAKALAQSIKKRQALPTAFSEQRDASGVLDKMHSGIRAGMDKRAKEDHMVTSDSANAFISIIQGKPISAIIQTQDMITKTVGADAHMQGRFYTAMKDGQLGVELAKNKKEAIEIITDMFNKGRDRLTAEEIARAGFTQDNAAEIALKMTRFRSATSKEAAEYGVGMALQTPLTGVMKKVGALQQVPVFGKLTMPFFQTPVNIINQTLMRLPVIPLGEDGAVGLPIHPRMWGDFMAGGKRRTDAVSKIVTGNAFTNLGYMLASQGVLVGIPSSTDEKRNLSQLLNTDVGSLLIGGRAVPLYMLGPLGFFLAHGANAHAHREKYASIENHSDDVQIGFQNTLLAGIASMAQVILQSPYMIAMEGAVKLIELDFEDQRKVEETVQGILGNVIGTSFPYSSAMRQLQRELDGERTRAITLTDSVLKNAGGFVDVRAYNALSETMPEAKGILVKNREMSVDPLMYAMIDGGFNVRPPRIDVLVKGDSVTPDVRVKLNAEQWEKINELVREKYKVRSALQGFVNSGIFAENIRTGNYRDNNAKLTEIITRARTMAQAELISGSPDLQEAIREEQNKRRGMGSATPFNVRGQQ